jgi:hypothetical protein
MKRLGKEVLLEDGDDEDEDGDVEGFKDPFTTAAPNSNSPTLSSPTGNSGGMRLQSNPTTSAISSPPLRSPLKSRGAAGGLSLPIPALDSTTTGPHQLMSVRYLFILSAELN